jgi:hypothetical protein
MDATGLIWPALEGARNLVHPCVITICDVGNNMHPRVPNRIIHFSMYIVDHIWLYNHANPSSISWVTPTSLLTMGLSFFIAIFIYGLFYLAPQGVHCLLLHPLLEIFTKNMEISPKIRRFRNGASWYKHKIMANHETWHGIMQYKCSRFQICKQNVFICIPWFDMRKTTQD